MMSVFQRIMKRHDIPTNDLNDDDQIGFDPPQVTLDESGTRADTYRSYILPVQNRRNLFIMKHGQVTKVLINNRNAAYGRI